MYTINSFKKIGIILILALSLLFTTACGSVFTIGMSQTNSSNIDDELPRIRTYENLIELLGTLNSNQNAMFFGASRDILESDASTKSESMTTQAGGTEYSDTNVQFQLDPLGYSNSCFL